MCNVLNFYVVSFAALIMVSCNGCKAPCVGDNDCSNGSRCNTRSEKPFCQKLYSGDDGSPCSIDELCKNKQCDQGFCWIDCGQGTYFEEGQCLPNKEGKFGKMQIGEGGSQGFCQQKHIEAVIKLRARAIRACYEAELQLRDDLTGKVVIRWYIDAEGRVDGARVNDSTLGNEKVESCMLAVIGRMHFQKPDSGICVALWPFVFSPG